MGFFFNGEHEFRNEMLSICEGQIIITATCGCYTINNRSPVRYYEFIIYYLLLIVLHETKKKILFFFISNILTIFFFFLLKRILLTINYLEMLFKNDIFTIFCAWYNIYILNYTVFLWSLITLYIIDHYKIKTTIFFRLFFPRR